ncbi:MAG: HxsD-like protein [Myxococcaceae bacterium]
MTRLSFDKSLYAGKAVDEAVKTFDRFATFALSETGDAWVVEVTAKNPAQEVRLTRELSNFALGLTVQQRQGVARP